MSLFTPDAWYYNLKKPSWTPSGRTIGTIWSILYPLIIISFIYVCYLYSIEKINGLVLSIFIVNIIANLSFTPLFFGLKNLYLSSLDILIVLGTIIASITLMFPISIFVVVLQLPYLIWVTTATTLQISMTWMNK